MKHPRNFTNGQLTIVDGASRSLVIVLEEGNVTFEEDETAPVIMTRGRIHGHADPVEKPIPVTFSVHFTEYYSEDRNGVGADDVSIRDFFKGDYNGAQSFTGCRPHTVSLQLYIENPCAPNEGKDETLNFEPFHCDKISFGEGEQANKLTFSGTAAQVKPNDGTPIRA